MQDRLGSIRRSLVFRAPDVGNDDGAVGTLVDKITSRMRKSRVLSRPADRNNAPLATAIRWRKGELIGCGAFGQVYMGINLDSGELLAVKQASAWVGESGDAFNSGGRDVSDTFVNSFWYLDQLAMAAKYNTKVYCDELPELQVFAGTWASLMAQHLLAAADRYGLERLKYLCEAKLCEDIAINTVATTLALAEQHHYFQLKSVCLRYVAQP